MFRGKKNPNEETRFSDTEQRSFWGALLGSLLFHALVFTLVFFMIQSGSRHGTKMGGREAESVGIVFVEDAGGGASQTGDAQEAELSGDAAPENESTPEQENPSEESPAQEEQTREAIGVGNTQEDMASRPLVTIRAGQPGSARNSGEVIGSGSGSGEGPGQAVGFAGLKGKGRRFVYILDRSESMRWPGERPIRYAVQEAIASIASLDPQKGALKFQLVVYNQDASIFKNSARLLDVTPANKQEVSHFLESLQAVGGTDPLAAIEKAVTLKPDVIFFLTDADEELAPMVLMKIHEIRLRAGVDQIHVMEFGKPDSKKLRSFQRLAQQNNGQYIFKDVTAL